MISMVTDEAAALPLLQFTGSMLWERRDRGKKRLLRAAYESIGGVQGALATHADSFMRDLSRGADRSRARSPHALGHPGRHTARRQQDVHGRGAGRL